MIRDLEMKTSAYLGWFGISYEIGELGEVWGLEASQHKSGVTEALHHPSPQRLRGAKSLTPQLLPFEGSKICDILFLFPPSFPG